MHLFQTAILVDQSNLANNKLIINSNQPKRQRKAKRNNSYIISKKFYRKLRVNEETDKKSLYYYQRSPNFCEADSSSDIPGKSVAGQQRGNMAIVQCMGILNGNEWKRSSESELPEQVFNI